MLKLPRILFINFIFIIIFISMLMAKVSMAEVPSDVSICTNNHNLIDYFHLDFATNDDEYFAYSMKEFNWPGIEVRSVVPIAPPYRYIAGNQQTLNASTIVTQSSDTVARAWVALGGDRVCDVFIGPSFPGGIQSMAPLINRTSLWIDPVTDPDANLTSPYANSKVIRIAPPGTRRNILHTVALLKKLKFRRVSILRTEVPSDISWEVGFREAFENNVTNDWRVVTTFAVPSSSSPVVTRLWIDDLLGDFAAQLPWTRVLIVAAGSQFEQFLPSLNHIRNISIIVFANGLCDTRDNLWQGLPGSLCAKLMPDAAKASEYLADYSTRNEDRFMQTVNFLLPFRYSFSEDLLPARNYFDYNSALVVDAVWFGLKMLWAAREQEDSSGGEGDGDSGGYPRPPPHHVYRRVNDNLTTNTFLSSVAIDGLTGELSLGLDGVRKSFLSEFQIASSDGQAPMVIGYATDCTGNVTWASWQGNISLPVGTFTFPFTEGNQPPPYRMPFNGTDLPIPGDPPSDNAPRQISDANSTTSDVWAYPLLACIGLALAISIIFVTIRLLRLLAYEAIAQFAPKNDDAPISILFSDIESSTALWAAHPCEMAAGLNLHNAVIRKCIERHRGYEVKTIGDSFMVAYKSPSDAMLCSLAIQRDLYHADWNRLLSGSATATVINDFYCSSKLERVERVVHPPLRHKPTQQAQPVLRMGMHQLIGNNNFKRGENSEISVFNLREANPQRTVSPPRVASDTVVINKSEDTTKISSLTSFYQNTAIGSYRHAATVHQRDATIQDEADDDKNRQSRVKVTIPLQNGLRVRIGLSFGPSTLKRTVTDPATGTTRPLLESEMAEISALERKMSQCEKGLRLTVPSVGHVSYDYFGQVVNESARVTDLGHGGQVLATKAFADAVHSEAETERKSRGLTSDMELAPKPFVKYSDQQILQQPPHQQPATKGNPITSTNVRTWFGRDAMPKSSYASIPRAEPNRRLRIFSGRTPSAFSTQLSPNRNQLPQHPPVVLQHDEPALEAVVPPKPSAPPRPYAHVIPVLTTTVYKGPNIGKINLGAVDIRHIGAKVELYQLTTTEFVDRTFPPLRLPKVPVASNDEVTAKTFKDEKRSNAFHSKFRTFHDTSSAAESQKSMKSELSRTTSVASAPYLLNSYANPHHQQHEVQDRRKHRHNMLANTSSQETSDADFSDNQDLGGNSSPLKLHADPGTQNKIRPMKKQPLLDLLKQIALRKRQREPELRMTYMLLESLIGVLQPSESKIALRLLLKRWQIDDRRERQLLHMPLGQEINLGSGNNNNNNTSTTGYGSSDHGNNQLLAFLASKVTPSTMLRLEKSYQPTAVGIGGALELKL